ncbi:peptidoglycan D,D-transpeptidase FtsI family protein [Priestia endophytica]|jgi:penicillin-binding protein A|uniref:serine-type D-Ala-D-Ala carboxypeptidase n=2 Tax=Priestia endophytica TaxID=135735 RepID=A0AAX1QB47_9BACI|nr:penicillin-binding protein 2 [Priestia endophytica]KAB2493580.1 penicillin-binding protein 2 [Priestia endophytica]KYG36086.1 penicillin-binding protein [Priestia endophytica]MBG9815027.1 penicillin-binding protein [Priestia endophytica]MCM3539621.1 penicillin-binding protein 2 [Priestia endophytica]RAS79179.1 penicillin-binding protein [Priestia endophytica]
MKKKRRKKTHISLRLNLLFFVVFLLFAILILRLGLVQIVQGEDYKREVEETQDSTVSNPAPRGKIYDRYHRSIVDNKPLNAITYTRFKNDPEQSLKVAKKLAKLIDKSTDKVTERDMKDYWLMIHPKKAKNLVPQSEIKKKELSDDKVYDLQLERITKKDLASISDADMEVIAIKREMDSGYKMTPQNIKNEGVTDAEYARVSENLADLPGVNTTTYWKRNYVYDGLLRSLLGNITSDEEGLPKDRLDYYLTRDYSRNDQVGKSYLESRYEELLNGQKEQVEYINNEAGDILDTELVKEGQRGRDLVLTIDMELQKAVEESLTKRLQAHHSGNPYMDRAFVMMMDPRNGDILAMAGKRYEKNEKTGVQEITDYALGNLVSSYNMGSTVKGATILAGLDSGAIQPGTTFVDEPIKIKGTPLKKSYKNMGRIGIGTALEMSSNVYMFKTVMAMADANYVPGRSLNIPKSTFDQLRNYYSQFGLGTETGLDLQNEFTGYQGTKYNPGFALDLGIGQYDTYTPLQLVQYVSTIANDGYRVKPQLLKEVREATVDEDKEGKILYESEPEILNRISMKDEYIDVVQNGFRRVMTSGTAAKTFKNAAYNPAGKTGTAQSFYTEGDRPEGTEPPETENHTLVGYAPYDNPEVAFAVVVPYGTTSDIGTMSQQVAKDALDAYFEKKEEGEKDQQENLNAAGGVQAVDSEDSEASSGDE